MGYRVFAVGYQVFVVGYQVFVVGYQVFVETENNITQGFSLDNDNT